MGINSEKEGKRGVGLSIPWKTPSFSQPNLFLHEIQDVLEVQVVVVVPDSRLDVGVENLVHLGWGNPKPRLRRGKTEGKQRKIPSFSRLALEKEF